ncbi:uncharacterized protein LOC129905962 [Episyrphus balteatus]|uniref:uncharacterized protein LOC129905962 n=1 Tax=Episyrphus balteatus TaxID=286459 RepID=UPI002485406C|nr:uncharacterized protein LOC129905962 [Episyrphus balteatus]
MNYNFVIILFTCVLGVTLASKKHKVDKVHSEVMSYVHQQMGDSVRMRRGGGGGSSLHLDCYNGFIPLINSLASNAKNVSELCVDDANKEKDQELSTLISERQQIENDVARITKSLDECGYEKGLNYFKCLADNTEQNRKLMANIRDKSSELISKFGDKMAAIDENESSCLMDAVDMAKIATDNAFGDLKSCLNGGPAIQPFIE